MAESTYSQFLPFLMQALGKSNPYVAAGTLGLGAIQTVGGLIGLSKLKRQPVPQYGITPELQQAYNLAEQRSRMGFTPTQTAAFEQQMARSQAADYKNAIAMGGGGLAQAIAGGLGGQRLQALNRFAAQDAAQQAANIGQYYGLTNQMTGQRNLMTRQQREDYYTKLKGASGALSSGLTNFASGINALGLGRGFGGMFGGPKDLGSLPSESLAQLGKMAQGKSTPPSYLNMPSDPFTGSLYKQPSMLQLPE